MHSDKHRLNLVMLYNMLDAHETYHDEIPSSLRNAVLGYVALCNTSGDMEGRISAFKSLHVPDEDVVAIVNLVKSGTDEKLIRRINRLETIH